MACFHFTPERYERCPVLFSRLRFARTSFRCSRPPTCSRPRRTALSTGKKVNTALDNPTNYFTAAVARCARRRHQQSPRRHRQRRAGAAGGQHRHHLAAEAGRHREVGRQPGVAERRSAYSTKSNRFRDDRRRHGRPTCGEPTDLYQRHRIVERAVFRTAPAARVLRVHRRDAGACRTGYSTGGIRRLSAARRTPRLPNGTATAAVGRSRPLHRQRHPCRQDDHCCRGDLRRSTATTNTVDSGFTHLSASGHVGSGNVYSDGRRQYDRLSGRGTIEYAGRRQRSATLWPRLPLPAVYRATWPEP